MQEETFEAICPTCKHKNRVHILVRENSFNEWEEVHCAYCGLAFDEVQAAESPKTEVID